MSLDGRPAPPSRRRRQLHGPERRGSPRRRGIGAVLALVLVAAAGTAYLNREAVLDAIPVLGDGECEATTLNVVVDPSLLEPVTEILEPLQGRTLSDGTCLRADVLAQEALQTVSGVAVLPRDRWPHVWIPDSSLWLSGASDLRAEPRGSLATTPLVLATSTSAVQELGWATKPPTWGAALTGVRPVAVDDVATTTEGLAAVLASRQSLGSEADADRAVAAAVLATQGAGAPSVSAALDAAGNNAPDAPLVPTTEQVVFAANRGTSTPALVAVYPADGSPSFDHPVLRVSAADWGGRRAEAGDLVIDTLLAPTAAEVIRRAGFRDASGRVEGGQGTSTDAVSPLELPTGPEVGQVLERLQQLATPTRMLALIDISQSMQAQAGRQTRITLVRDAAKSALGLLPDNDAVGAWVFASELEGDQDWAVLSPIERLDAEAGDVTHREQVVSRLDGLPEALRSGGTSLYDTTIAALGHVQEQYDPQAANVLVLLTDGANEDSRGATLAQAVAALTAAGASDEPVRVIAVGIGADADMEALGALAAASPNGTAYQALDPQQLQTVLFDALSSRT